MSYDEILEISVNILEKSEIGIKNLSLLYELPKKDHYNLDLFLFKKMGGQGQFNHSQIINLTVNNVNFKFIEKNKKFFVE